MTFPNIDAVPAYWASRPGQEAVPFIIALRLINADGMAQLPPSVELSIDRALEVTDRSGVAHGVIDSMPSIVSKAEPYIQRVSTLGVPAIVLFRCNTPELAEHLMTHISATYEVSMVQRKQL